MGRLVLTLFGGEVGGNVDLIPNSTLLAKVLHLLITSQGGYGYRRSGRDKYGPPTRTEYRLIVENLSSRCSWQDLKVNGVWASASSDLVIANINCANINWSLNSCCIIHTKGNRYLFPKEILYSFYLKS